MTKTKTRLREHVLIEQAVLAKLFIVEHDLRCFFWGYACRLFVYLCLVRISKFQIIMGACVACS